MKRIFCGTSLCYGSTWQPIGWEYLARAGIKNVDLHIAQYGDFALVPEIMIDEPWYGMWQISIPDLKDLLKRIGVTPMISIANCDVLYREGVEMIKRRMEFSRKMGVKYFVNGPWPHEKIRGAERIVYDRWKELCDYAEMLGFEANILQTHGWTTNNARECLETIKRVGRKNLKIEFDTASTYFRNKGLDIIEELKLLREHIAAVWLYDFSGETGTFNFPPLGEGIVDFPKVFRTLDDFGFKGPYLLALEGWSGTFNASVDRYHEDVRTSIQYLREIGVWE